MHGSIRTVVQTEVWNRGTSTPTTSLGIVPHGVRGILRVRFPSQIIHGAPLGDADTRAFPDFAKTLIPLSISKDIPEKKEMIRLFLEVRTMPARCAMRV